MASRLANSTSPYLEQHADNPVDWYPWGDEALARARQEERPILLSIGYSACHWCHVMERESFEDPEIAGLMNRHFVNVKVDREERPDLDEVYMAATQALNGGQGGWPMTVFLTPEQEPFFAGTYFPPDDAVGRPGFRRILSRIAELWSGERGRVEQQAGALVAHLRQDAALLMPGDVPPHALGGAFERLARDFDTEHGGFGPAPKFPPTGAVDVLLRHHQRSGDDLALRMVVETLEAMAHGGIYDQLGGGFARYSTDERWLVPHFEKMLYDNALLVRSYLDAGQVTSRPGMLQVAAEVLDWVASDMTGPEGGFLSSLDADSEGEEGRFYVWTPEEVEAVVGAEDAELVCRWFGIQPGGNWEGRSIPNRPLPLKRVAGLLRLDAEDAERRVESARAALLEARAKRVPPGLDDKVITAWKGLMISAFAEGARVLRDRRYLYVAQRAADFVLERLRRADGGLLRAWREGRASACGVLEDHAYLASGLIDLYEAGGEAWHLREALGLAERMLTDFWDPESGAFYTTGTSHERLLVRRMDGMDGALPSPNALAAAVLLRLGHHFDRPDLMEAAQRAVSAYGNAITRYPKAFCRALGLVDFLREGPVELVFVGGEGDPGAAALRDAVADRYLPNRVIAHRAAGDDDDGLPLLKDRPPVDGKSTLYICRGGTCLPPITDPGLVAEALA